MSCIKRIIVYTLTFMIRCYVKLPMSMLHADPSTIYDTVSEQLQSRHALLL